MLAWELGGGLGHVAPLAQLAAPLLAAGHAVDFVLADLRNADAGMGARARHPGVRLWQAPVWLAQLRGVPDPGTYAELLLHAGYLDARRLRPLAQAWRHLLLQLQPDMLLADHAPTALLAAKGLPLRRATCGTGFFQPPALSPMPGFRTWEHLPEARTRTAEQRALATCNSVLSAWGEPPLPALHHLLDVDECFLLTWPALDHYGGGASPVRPAGARYWGALPGPALGIAPAWPAGDGPGAAAAPQLLAYLKAESTPVPTLLQALRGGPWRTLAYVPGLPAAARQALASPWLRLSEQPVQMAEAVAVADAVLCHAGSGTACAALAAGKPLLLLPMHAEQRLFSLQVQAAGAGLMLLEPEATPARLLATLAQLQQPQLRAGALALAQRHGPGGSEDFGDVAARVAARCLDLVTPASRFPSSPPLPVRPPI